MTSSIAPTALTERKLFAWVAFGDLRIAPSALAERKFIVWVAIGDLCILFTSCR